MFFSKVTFQTYSILQNLFEQLTLTNKICNNNNCIKTLYCYFINVMETTAV